MNSEKILKEPQINKRIEWVDIAKAIGILLVLINHSGFSSNAVTFYGGMIYMPIFFILTGYTFRRKSESIVVFAKKKAKRLLIPYGVFNIFLVGIFIIKDIVISGNFKNISTYILGVIYSRNNMYPVTDTYFGINGGENIYLMTALNAPTWFLTGMFVTMVLFKILIDRFGDSNKDIIRTIVLLLLAGFALEKICPVLLPWSADTAFLFAAFMMFGYLVRNNNILEKMEKHPVTIAAVFLGFIILSNINGSVNLSIRDYGLSIFIYYVTAVLGCILVMLLSEKLESKDKIFKYIGKHTITILGLHLLVFALVQAVGAVFGAGIPVIKVVQIIAALVMLAIADDLVIKISSR